MTIVFDFETRSEADLKKVGAWAYSEHPSTEVVCACWQFDDGAQFAWVPGQKEPAGSLGYLVQTGHLIEAHNAAFEFSIWNNVCVPRYGWPRLPVEQVRDSMAVASYYALPAALDELCRVLGLPGKDPEGARLIQRYSKLHLKTAKRAIPPEDLQKFVVYCKRDVEMEARVGQILGELPDRELPYFLHDFEVNARGLMLDPDGIASAQAIVDKRAAELEAEFQRLTGLGPGQRDRIVEWLAARGLELPNLRADTIEELLDDGTIENEPAPALASEVRRVLQVRQQHSRASTKKLDAMMRQRGKDGRARFQTRYHGAATGRNTGTGFQPLNLNRGQSKLDPDQLVRDIRIGDPQWLDMLYGDAMAAVSWATRHWIMAAPGHRILAGDFSSIEAVVNACLAGEAWKVQLFRDRGDPYCAFASKVVGREVRQKGHPELTKQDIDDRQHIGKSGELAFGYQGSLNAWRKFDSSNRHSDEAVLSYVRAWRELHPAIREQWYGLENAAIEAANNPGRVTGYRQVGFERVDGWLTMILPNGKRLWYWAPQVRLAWPHWHKPAEHEECAAGTCGCKKRPQLTYQAQKEGRWRRVSTYGGKLTENLVQAVSREILKVVELRVKAAGYAQVLGVYDEIVCEVPAGQGSAEELQRIMGEPAGDWCRDWPIRAEVWEGARYKK